MIPRDMKGLILNRHVFIQNLQRRLRLQLAGLVRLKQRLVSERVGDARVRVVESLQLVLGSLREEGSADLQSKVQALALSKAREVAMHVHQRGVVQLVVLLPLLLVLSLLEGLDGGLHPFLGL